MWSNWHEGGFFEYVRGWFFDVTNKNVWRYYASFGKNKLGTIIWNTKAVQKIIHDVIKRLLLIKAADHRQLIIYKKSKVKTIKNLSEC